MFDRVSREHGIEHRLEHGRLDNVRLDPRLGDKPNLARVGDHHPTDVWPDHLGDRARVAGRLHHDMVILGQYPSERRQVVAHHAIRPNRQGLPSFSITASTRMIVPPRGLDLTRAGGQHGNYRSALAAHPGRRGGQITVGLSAHSLRVGLPALTFSRAPRPGWAHHNADPKISGTSGAPKTSCRITASPGA